MELLRREFLDLIENKLVKKEEIEKDTEKFEKYYNKPKFLLEESLSTQQNTNNQQQISIKMANFNLEIAFKVIPETIRTALGTSAPTTFINLKSILTNRYKNTKTVAQLQASLSNFSQKSMSVHAYHEKLLNLIAELNELQIREIQNYSTIQSDTITLIKDNYALNVFKNGLIEELKPTIFASRQKELNEAVQLALE